MAQRVYIETTIPSYLTAWPSRDLIIAGHQQLTKEWWQTRRNEFELCISQFQRDAARFEDAPRNGEHMPTALRSGPYRFYFYSHEPNEPPHVHVDRDDLSAKFWLEPVALARNFGFSAKELRRIQKLISQHQAEFLEAWNGHLGAGG